MRSRSTTVSTRAFADAIRELRRYFRRNGCVRRQNLGRLSREGYRGYKKGDEVRLTAMDEQELRCLQALLIRAGFCPGRPYAKGRQHRLPLYGREAVRRFLRLIGSRGNAEPDAAPNSRPLSHSPASLGIQTPDSPRTPASGGCG